MLNRILVLSAAIAATGLMAAQLPAADPLPLPTGGTVHAADLGATLPPGITAKNLNDDKAIEKTFKSLSEDGLSKSGFDNIVGLLVDQDRVRLKDGLDKGTSLSNIDGNNNKHLTDTINTLNQFWKQKYGQDFSMDYTKVFTSDFISIKTGEVSDANLLIGKWPIDSGSMAVAAEPGKVTGGDAQEAQKKMFGGDVNLEKGREVAVAHLSMIHSYPSLNASLIHEAGGWKFDVPNNLSAKTIYTNLSNNLDYIANHKAELPSDVNQAYREVTHVVTASLYDIDVSRENGTALMPGTGVRPSAENR